MRRTLGLLGLALIAACAAPVEAPLARADVAAETLAYYAGSYALEGEPGRTLVLEAGEGRLVATLDGRFEALEFFPDSETHFSATAQPYALEIAEDACKLTLTTGETRTTAHRIVD